MTGHNGAISGSSAVPSVASAGGGGRSMKRGKEPAFAGGSSTAIVRSSLPPSKSLKGSEAEAEGGEKKRKNAEFDASRGWLCNVCEKPFKSRYAVCGHLRVHKSPPKQQAEEPMSTSPDLGQRKLNTKEGSENKGDGSAMAEGGTSSSARRVLKFDLNKAPEDNEDCGGNGSAMAEGGASTSARRVLKFDLNKAPEDNEDCGGDKESA